MVLIFLYAFSRFLCSNYVFVINFDFRVCLQTSIYSKHYIFDIKFDLPFTFKGLKSFTYKNLPEYRSSNHNYYLIVDEGM